MGSESDLGLRQSLRTQARLCRRGEAVRRRLRIQRRKDGDFGGFFPGVPIGGAGGGIGPESAGTVESLEFEMELGSGAELRTGSLIARGDDHAELLNAAATSGRPGHQDAGNQWEMGQGRLPALPGYGVQTDTRCPKAMVSWGCASP